MKWLASVVVLMGFLPLAGCGEEQAVSYSSLGAVPSYPQRPGSAAAGYQALVNEDYIRCGIPYRIYRQHNPLPKPSEKLPGRLGRNDELPYYLSAHVSASGVELVTSNCLRCHAGYFNGKLVIGLGNESLDFTADASFNAERLGSEAVGEAETAEWRRWADRIAAIAPYMITETIGVNAANNLTLALMAHRDPETLAWSQQPRLELPPARPEPVSVPPWWRMKKKHAMFYNSEGRGDHARIMMLGAILCSDSVAEVRAIDRYAPDIRAYLASLEAPAYPFAIDPALAASGRAVFERHCAACHGRYGEDESYPNLVIGYEEVGTDPALAMLATGAGASPYIRWFNGSFYGELGQAEPAPGYYAPPLDGIWATAPYLHNGSVPSLAALLDSPSRPRYWSRSFDSTDYDPRTLGWNYTEPSYGKDGAKDPDERKRIYDTTLPGYSNRGHSYGDGLSDAERSALLEYIKTL